MRTEPSRPREWCVRIYAVAPSGRVAVIQTMPGRYLKTTADTKAREIMDRMRFDRNVEAVVVETYVVAEPVGDPVYRRGDLYGGKAA